MLEASGKVAVTLYSGQTPPAVHPALGPPPRTATQQGPGTSRPGNVFAQINLHPPSTRVAAGIAEFLHEGSKVGLVVTAHGLQANTKHNAYGIWLSDSPTHSRLLGFVNPPVGHNGRLRTAGLLPSDAANYKQLLVTLENQGAPKAPGLIVLEGSIPASALRTP